MKLRALLAASFLACSLLTLPACTAEAKTEPAKKGAVAAVAVNNTHCPVNKTNNKKDVEVDGEHFVVHDGKRIGLCCDKCEEPFKADPAKFMAALDTIPTAKK